MDVLAAMGLFRRVVEVGSFSAVARETGQSQPTVSRSVSELEQRLSTKLINRSTREINMTDAGKQYYAYCVRILNDLSEAESNIRNDQSQLCGTLRVNTPITFGRMEILPKLWGFYDLYPELNIDLMMDDHYVDLVKEGVDVSIRVGPKTDSSLIARKICDSQRVMVANQNYIDMHGEPKTLQDLKQHNCIVYTLLTTHNEWHFTGPNGKESIRVRGRFSTNNPDAIREAVIAGAGIAVTPLWLVKDYLNKGSLNILLPNYQPTPLEIHALYPERQFVTTRVRFFIDYLVKMFEGANI